MGLDAGLARRRSPRWESHRRRRRRRSRQDSGTRAEATISSRPSGIIRGLLITLTLAALLGLAALGASIPSGPIDRPEVGDVGWSAAGASRASRVEPMIDEGAAPTTSSGGNKISPTLSVARPRLRRQDAKTNGLDGQMNASDTSGAQLRQLQEHQKQRMLELKQRFITNRAINDGAYYTLLVIYALFIVVGTISNSLICLTVILKPKVLSPRNLFIVNLAGSDLLLCVFTMPFSFIELSMKMWHMGLAPCKLVAGLQATSIFVSTISITAIALDRYKVIVYPTHKETTNGARGFALLLASIWAGALLLSAPLFWYRTVQVPELPPHAHKSEIVGAVEYCVEDWPFTHGRGIYSVISMVLQYVLPITIVSIVYAKISDKLQKRLIRRQQLTQLECQQKRQLNLIKRTHTMLMSVSLIFGLSWLPLNLLNVLGDFADLFKDQDELFRIVFAVCHLIGCSSACSNPILYGYLNENFRKEFHQVYTHHAHALRRRWRHCNNKWLCCGQRPAKSLEDAYVTTTSASGSSSSRSGSTSSSCDADEDEERAAGRSESVQLGNGSGIELSRMAQLPPGIEAEDGTKSAAFRSARPNQTLGKTIRFCLCITNSSSDEAESLNGYSPAHQIKSRSPGRVNNLAAADPQKPARRLRRRTKRRKSRITRAADEGRHLASEWPCECECHRRTSLIGGMVANVLRRASAARSPAHRDGGLGARDIDADEAIELEGRTPGPGQRSMPPPHSPTSITRIASSGGRRVWLRLFPRRANDIATTSVDKSDSQAISGDTRAASTDPSGAGHCAKCKHSDRPLGKRRRRRRHEGRRRPGTRHRADPNGAGESRASGGGTRSAIERMGTLAVNIGGPSAAIVSVEDKSGPEVGANSPRSPLAAGSPLDGQLALVGTETSIGTMYLSVGPATERARAGSELSLSIHERSTSIVVLNELASCQDLTAASPSEVKVGCGTSAADITPSDKLSDTRQVADANGSRDDQASEQAALVGEAPTGGASKSANDSISASSTSSLSASAELDANSGLVSASSASVPSTLSSSTTCTCSSATRSSSSLCAQTTTNTRSSLQCSLPDCPAARRADRPADHAQPRGQTGLAAEGVTPTSMPLGPHEVSVDGAPLECVGTAATSHSSLLSELNCSPHASPSSRSVASVEVSHLSAGANQLSAASERRKQSAASYAETSDRDHGDAAPRLCNGRQAAGGVCE